MTDDDDSNEIEDSGDDAIIGVALRWSVMAGLLIAVLAGVLWLVLRNEEETQEAQVFDPVAPSQRQEEQRIPALPMKDATQSSGIDFVHETGRAGEKLLPETMGSGVAVFDYNGDGHQDIFFANSKRWPWDSATGPVATCRMYEGDGKGHFVDVSQATQTNLSLYAMGVAVGDYDNDGDRDLYISAVGRNVLLRNDEGVFVDVTETAHVGGADEDWSTSVGFFDYDRDGNLDLFVCNYVTWSKDLDLSQKFTLDGVNRAYGPPRAFTGSFSTLYRNRGDGTFEDVSAASGIQIRNAATDVPLGKSMGVTFLDANRDGWLDIMVANDTVRNFLFENNQDGTFNECGQLCGVAYDRSGNARGAMGIDCSIFRPDSTLAIGIGNFANEPSALYMARPGRTQFIDAAMFTGFGPPTRQGLTFGLFFCDLDLDGRLDIFGANGHLEEEISKTQSTQRYEQPPQLFWNAGRDAPSELVEVPAELTGEDFQEPMVGRGAAYGDFDGDGDQDIVVSTSGGPARVFLNGQSEGNHYLRLRLEGTEGNRDAIGAFVSVKSGDQMLHGTVMPTKSYLSQCELELTFGLGQLTNIDSVQVVWPQGEMETFDSLPIDQLSILKEGSGMSQP